MCKKNWAAGGQVILHKLCNIAEFNKHTHFCFILSANSTVVTDWPEIQEEKIW